MYTSIYTIMQSILNNLMALQRKANCLTLMSVIFLALRYSSFKVFCSKSDKYYFFTLCQQRYVVVYVRVSNSCCAASAEFVEEEAFKTKSAKSHGLSSVFNLAMVVYFVIVRLQKNSISPCTLQSSHVCGRMTYHLLITSNLHACQSYVHQELSCMHKPYIT